MSKRIRLLACTLLLPFAACSGPAVNGYVPSGSPPSQLPISSRFDRGAGVKAAIVLHVPRRTKRRARYISPSTAAVAIAIAPATACAACTPKFTLDAQLASNAPSCSVDSSTNGVTCTISFVLEPGKYVGSMQTYDGWNSASQKPSGNVLSQNQSFPIGVTAGKANVAAITLAGIPRSIEVLPLSAGNLTVLPTGLYGSTRLEITPERTASMLAVALDSDGNAIFGPGSPKFTVTVGGGFTSSVLGNNVLLRSPATPAKGAWPITIATTTCSSGGTCSTGNWKISAAPLVAFASASSSSVTIYSGLKNSVFARITASSGLSSPAAAAFDRNGNLFVANATGGSGNKGSVVEYAAPYTQSAPTATIADGIDSPAALGIAPKSGNLAVLNTGGAAPSVAVYGPGKTVPISSPFTTAAGATGIAFDVNDNLWYATTSPSGDVVELLVAKKYAAPAGHNVAVGGSPSSIALDADGNLYVADSGSGQVSQYLSPSYSSPTAIASSVTGSPKIIADNDLPSGLSFSYGATLIGIAGANTIDMYAPLSSQFFFNESDGAFQSQAFDQDADLWLAPAGYPEGYGYLSWHISGTQINTTETTASAIAAFPPP